MIKIIYQIFKSLNNFIKHLYFRYRIFTEKGNCAIPNSKKILACFKGLKGDQWVWYDLDNNEINQYVSEYEFYLTKVINRQYHLILDDKLIFSDLFGKYINVPSIYFYICKGKILTRNSKQCSLENLIQILNKENKLILKPVNGARGEKVHIISVARKLHVNGTNLQKQIYYLGKELIGKDQLNEFISNLDEFIITEFVFQHQYAKNLYNETTNTIRIITIQDPESAKWIIPNAIHRIGTKNSYPVDNFSNGGLTVEIDLETGILGRAFDPTNCNPTTFYISKHPDTGAQITGVKIPYWEELIEKLLDIANKFPYVYFIAWDVVITKQGFSIVEINNSSGLNIFQVFGGVRNSKLGEFYKHHGVIE